MSKDKGVKMEDLEKRVKYLEGRVEELEKKIKSTKQGNKPNKPNSSQNPKPSKSNPKEKKSTKGKSSYSKRKIKGGKVECFVNEDLKAVSEDDKDLIFNLEEKTLVDNDLVMGDNLIVETHKDGNIKEVKVSQRNKRNYAEALVTVKSGIFYAVSEYATHKLIDYDVKTKGVLKGFDVTVILPQNEESKAKTVLIKEVESASGHTIEEKKGNEKPSKQKEKKEKSNDKEYDPRVLEDDDLV